MNDRSCWNRKAAVVQDSALKEKGQKIWSWASQNELMAAGTPLPKEGATSGRYVSHEQRPLGGPLNPELLHSLSLFCKVSITNFYILLLFLPDASWNSASLLICLHFCCLPQMNGNINICSLAVSMWSWMFLVTYQQTSGWCQPLICVTPAASGRKPGHLWFRWDSEIMWGQIAAWQTSLHP